MLSMLRRCPALVCLTISLLLAGVSATAQEVPQDHAQIFKRAVDALNAAEKKLAGNYTAEAKALVKEASSLFAILQKEMPEHIKSQELTSGQEEQYNANQKLGEDSMANGQRLEQAAAEKQKKGDLLEAQGFMDAAAKVQQEVVRDLGLAQKAYLKAAIYHLRNSQLTFDSLHK